MIETPTFGFAAVAAPHLAAAEAGQVVLAQGGNAVEAMVAMAATVAVVYPHMNGLGGDGFWLVREPGGRLHGLDASGPAGALATIKRYQAKGYHEVPPRGPDAAVTVPGAVGGWRLALELARSLGGQMPLDLLLGDAIRWAREGCPVSQSEGRYVLKEAQALQAAPGFAEVFFVDGKRPEAGTLRRQPALAATLERLAHVGLRDFYRGDVGREIAADLERLESPVTRRDLETYEARVVQPLSMRRGPAQIVNLPPPTQGLASLLILGIAGRLEAARTDTADLHHGLIEATKRAYAIRDRVVTDPRHLTKDPAAFLENSVLEREAAAIDARRAAPFPLPPPADGDTIWMGAIDERGLAVSYIQSLFWEFGSGCVLPGTGVLWSNRGRGFSLDPRSLNPLEPGRKPFHTLNPALAVFDDGRVLSYGTMGGEGQPQVQAQIFTRYADLGLGLAEAVDAPRWLLGRAWGAQAATLKVEDRFDPEIIDRLARRGHAIEEIGQPYADALGHAGMLVKHRRDGRVEATHDPRSDGGALGL
ncbi:MAG TPA: gamma-glutamyltransferase [Microvirga sp.]|jgi:gamma-glutamyltranspeptidase/glutathione hydrolase